MAQPGWGGRGDTSGRPSAAVSGSRLPLAAARDITPPMEKPGGAAAAVPDLEDES